MHAYIYTHHTHVFDNEHNASCTNNGGGEAKGAISGLREKTRTKQVPKGKCPPTIVFKRTLHRHPHTHVL